MPGIRESKKKMTRQRIIQAASELFGEAGYDNVSMENIAQKAEIGVGTLYNYFANKGDVFVGAFTQVADSNEKVSISTDDLIGECPGEIVVDYCMKYLKTYFRLMGFTLTKKLFKDILIAGFQSYKSDNKLLNRFMREDFIMIDKVEMLIADLKDKGIVSELKNPRDMAETVYAVIMYEMLVYAFTENVEMDEMEQNIKRKIVQIM